MILHIFRCETCKKEHPFTPDSLQPDYTQVPADWIMTIGAGIMHHFCCEKCLSLSLGVHPALLTEQPQSKMRRFLLVDGETADEFEGVKWSNGRVSLDLDSPHVLKYHCDGYFPTWEEFKLHHEGCGVTWIDQEVSGE